MLTFCNYFVLWLLRCVQLRLVTVTFCDVNVVWCYVLSQYRIQACIFDHVGVTTMVGRIRIRIQLKGMIQIQFNGCKSAKLSSTLRKTHQNGWVWYLLSSTFRMRGALQVTISLPVRVQTLNEGKFRAALKSVLTCLKINTSWIISTLFWGLFLFLVFDLLPPPPPHTSESTVIWGYGTEFPFTRNSQRRVGGGGRGSVV